MSQIGTVVVSSDGTLSGAERIEIRPVAGGLEVQVQASGTGGLEGAHAGGFAGVAFYTDAAAFAAKVTKAWNDAQATPGTGFDNLDIVETPGGIDPETLDYREASAGVREAYFATRHATGGSNEINWPQSVMQDLVVGVGATPSGLSRLGL